MDDDADDYYLYGKDKARAIKPPSFRKTVVDDIAEPDSNQPEPEQILDTVSESPAEEPSSEDDVEIVLEEEPSEPNPPQSLITLTPGEKPGESSPNEPASHPGGNKLDIDKSGTWDGKPIYNVELDSIDDKGWRKPGADITDYFNFGLDETSWRRYCHKQQMVREENTTLKRIQVHESGSGDKTRPHFGSKKPIDTRSLPFSKSVSGRTHRSSGNRSRHSHNHKRGSRASTKSKSRSRSPRPERRRR